MSYPCTLCEYTGSSARQLSRHKAVTHVKNPLTCILCPFVTAYQTNLLRHRREVHGILGSKGNKSCKFCGFEANDNDTLILHQQEAHKDILKSARERFAREKKTARGPVAAAPARSQASRQLVTAAEAFPVQNQYEGEGKEDDDKDFWKEGFIDNPPNLMMNLAQASDANENEVRTMNSWFRNGTDASPLSFETSSEYGSSRASTPLPANKSPATELNDNLAPTRIRRQYTCNDCGIRTVNPREFLYHRRDMHNQKVKIVECPYCVYACQYFQKLQRHILLVHKLETSMTPPAEVLAATQHSSEEPANEGKTQSLLQKPRVANNLEYNASNSATVPPLKLKVKLNKVDESHETPQPDESGMYSYTVINEEHEPSSYIDDCDKQKRKYFRCDSCGYKTNVHYLYKKHIKYHNAPKIKCELCDFESPYSWNVERHARSHKMNGAYKCLKCNFSSDKPQAITIHVNQHHRDKNVDKSDVVKTSDVGHEKSGCDEQVIEQEGEEGIPSDYENDYQMETKSNQSSTGIFSRQVSTDSSKISVTNTAKSITYVRKADGKIVAKPSVTKKCKYCNFQADSFAKLQKHESSFHPEKRFQCPLCEIRFENLVWLQRHLSHMHQENDEASNIVNILDKLNPKKKRPPSTKAVQESAAASSMSLKKLGLAPRKKMIVDKASTKCNICGYQMRWISELEKHMRVHTKEKPFSCPYCSFKSKWKGDLNRHIQKYHSRLPMPDLTAMEQKANRAFSLEPRAKIQSQEQVQADENIQRSHQETVYENSLNQTTFYQAECEDYQNNEEAQEAAEEESILGKQGKVKVYKCCYCEFMCTTASRFHVHFVQHLNTKPFMCSICGHRSNWEWDVTKHIKMKSQRDPEHFNAKPVLIHDSGKRDYRKYNKYMVWVEQMEVERCSVNSNKIDFRAKRQKMDPSEIADYDENDAMIDEQNQGNEHEDNVDPESIVITPDISFAFPNVSNDKAECMNTSYQSLSLQPNVPYVSDTAKTINEPASKLFYCAYCSYTHKDSKALVSHLSVHAGKKPYRCRFCGFSSNWKEVVSRHASSRHNGSVKDVEQLFKYTVTKYICRIIDESGDLNLGPEVTTSDSLPTSAPKTSDILVEEERTCVEKQPLNRQIIPGRISGFRGSFKCDLCPFRAEKAFHMDFHLKRHQPAKGADFKCPHCPYWVNAKKSLVKHIYLHDFESEVAFQEVNANHNDVNQDEQDYEGDDDQSEMEVSAANENTSVNTSQVRQSASVFKNKCDSCPFIAGTKTQLLYHKQFHRPNRNAPYKCNLCSYAVSYQHLLNQHLRVHYQDGELVKNSLEDESDEPSESDKDEGSDIPFVFVQNGNSKQKLFQCRYCPTTSKRRTYIYVHEQMHTQNSNESFKCSQCVFTTNNSTAFLTHLGTHNKETKEEQEEEHQPQHHQPHLAHASAEESYKYIKQCEQSQQENQNSSGPTMSVVDANSIRYGNRRMFSYVCQDCPAAFKSPGDLKIHSAFHSEVNYPHMCPYCTYRAKNKPQLCKHLYVHTADYITKRANSYPEGMKLTIGDALNKMKNDLQASQKSEALHTTVDLPAPPPLYKPQRPSQPLKNMENMNSAPTTLQAFRNVQNTSQSSFETSQDPHVEKSIGNITKSIRPALVRNINPPTAQMAILENSETKDFLETLKPKIVQQFNYRCDECPAAFVKSATLQFHKKMHGSAGQFKCPLCNYAGDNQENVSNHIQLHSLVSQNTSNIYRCVKCPSVFAKTSQLEKHVYYHGKESKNRCSKCDYSCDSLEKLQRHETVHRTGQYHNCESEGEDQADDSHKNSSILNSPLKASQIPSPSDEKSMYCCDRCPYVHSRRDAVQSHQKRHDQLRNFRDGKKCNYCDYICLQPSYLREHTKLHFYPPYDRKAIVYQVYKGVEVWKTGVNESESSEEVQLSRNELLFRDRGDGFQFEERFEPKEDDEDLLELLKNASTEERQEETNEKEEKEVEFGPNDKKLENFDNVDQINIGDTSPALATEVVREEEQEETSSMQVQNEVQ
ncbi:zinc finger protein Xfin-like protein [Dinothrombium tinctorium]|nr:zinc finger protein Xfin-like protein [Dinothrombium tinctorium]RWS11846.1 zinc finger protein Xfin-like protein [Dinothrombium tinctorium]